MKTVRMIKCKARRTDGTERRNEEYNAWVKDFNKRVAKSLKATKNLPEDPPRRSAIYGYTDQNGRFTHNCNGSGGKAVNSHAGNAGNDYHCSCCGASAYYDGRCGDGPVLTCGCDRAEQEYWSMDHR